MDTLCDPRVSHKWLIHSGDFVVVVQKRLVNGSDVGDGACRLCGAFLDQQLQHSETCNTAGATACVDAL